MVFRDYRDFPFPVWHQISEFQQKERGDKEIKKSVKRSCTLCLKNEKGIFTKRGKSMPATESRSRISNRRASKTVGKVLMW